MIRNVAIAVMIVLGFVYSQEWTLLKAGRSGLVSNYVKSIQIVKGVLYAATDKGVSIISLTKDSIAQIDKTKMPKGVPSCMQAVGDTMWIGAGNTLVIYNMISGAVVSIASEESGIQNTITSIAGSGDDVWIGTDGGGAFAFSRSGRHFTRFNRNSGLSSDNIRSVTALSDTILFGTSANGISLYSRNDERHSRLDRYDGLTNNFVTAFVHAFGKLYVGTYKGLSIFDPAKRDLRAAPGSRVMKEDLILSMAGDGRYLWLGGMGLVTRYDTKTDSVLSWSKTEGVPEDFITGLAVYRDYLYAATDGNGIAILNKKVPTVSLDRIDFKNRKGIVYGNFDSQSQPLTQSWSFFSPAARSVVFSKGVSPTGQSNGAIAEWDLSQVIDGAYVLQFAVQDATGAKNETELRLYTDTFDPEITLEDLPSYSGKEEFRIAGSFRERNIAKIVLYPGGVAAVINPADRRFEGTVKLFPGKNLVRAVAFDRSGRTMELRRQVVFSDKPAEIKFGQFAKAVRDRSALVRGNVISETPLKTLTVFPGSQPVSVDKTTGAFSATVMLSSFGENSLLFKAEDAGGRVVSAEVVVYLDNEGPAISVDLLPEFIADSVVNISGTIQSADLSEVTVSPQGAPASLDAKRQKFSVVRKLREGRNVFSVTASDTLKNITQKQVVITRDVVKPRLAPVSVASVVMTDSYSFTGRFDEENISTIKIEPGGIAAEIDTATFSYTAVLNVADGDNIFNVTATDKAGNFSMSRISLVARLEKQENVVDRLKKKIEMLEKKVDSLKAVKEPKKQK